MADGSSLFHRRRDEGQTGSTPDGTCDSQHSQRGRNCIGRIQPGKCAARRPKKQLYFKSSRIIALDAIRIGKRKGITENHVTTTNITIHTRTFSNFRGRRERGFQRVTLRRRAYRIFLR